MLKVNNLVGFGSARRGVTPITARVVGTYTVTFTASATSSSATVLSADLGAADPNKKLFFFASIEAGTGLTNAATISFGGNPVANMIGAHLNSWTGFFQAGGISFTGSGDQSLQLTVQSSISETLQVTVVEVINSLPIEQCALYPAAPQGGTLTWTNVRIPADAIVIGAAMNITDTATATWSGLTELVDQDAGDNRITLAGNFTPAASATDATITVTGSAGNMQGILLVVPNAASVVAKVSLLQMRGSTGSSTTATVTNFGGPDRGAFQLLLFVAAEVNTTITAITLNGVDISSGLIGSVVNTGATPDLTMYAYSWPIDSSNSPSGSLVVTYGASITGAVVIFTAFAVHGGTIGTPVTANANDGSADLTTTISEGGTIIALEAHGTDTDAAAWSNVTEVADVDIGAYRLSMGLRHYCAAEASRAVAATFTSQQHIGMSVPINP